MVVVCNADHLRVSGSLFGEGPQVNRSTVRMELDTQKQSDGVVTLQDREAHTYLI